MFSTNTSEIKGTLQESPFAELLAETAQSNLGGSFRLIHEEEKAIIYLSKGQVVYAVSNHRQHRLFEVLLRSNQITRESLTKIPEFTNDLALAKNLVKNNLFPQETINEILKYQIREIIKSALAWEKGGWSFSHLARAKENLQFEIDLTPILLEYARGLSGEKIIRRFKSFEERFLLKEDFSLHQNLFPQEGYIYSRLSHDPMKVQEIKQISGISDVDTLKNLYVLWIAGFTQRKNWNSIFTDFRLQQILSAKLILKKGAAELTPEKKPVEAPVLLVNNGEDLPELPPEKAEKELLETYLLRVESADSFYEILGVPLKANTAQIKTAYFGLAKSYHPDRFHQETDVTLQQRVQNAFSELARAYDTLKDAKAREVYDFKLRKFLESVEFQKKAAGTKSGTITNLDKARDEFDQGFDFLMSEEYAEAIPFLTRAVQLAPDNPRYHAYFGKALSFVESQRFKAEAEIRQAMKLDSGSPSYWIMLAEFYLQFNLLKRAEGELQRLLTQFPGNREALALLDGLPIK
jgi:curved DNA-binding protein CbpA